MNVFYIFLKSVSYKNAFFINTYFKLFIAYTSERPYILQVKKYVETMNKVGVIKKNFITRIFSASTFSPKCVLKIIYIIHICSYYNRCIGLDDTFTGITCTVLHNQQLPIKYRKYAVSAENYYSDRVRGRIIIVCLYLLLYITYNCILCKLLPNIIYRRYNIIMSYYAPRSMIYLQQ